MNTDSQRLSAGLLSAVLLVVVTGAAVAQVPSSTNPANLAIYPSEGQPPDLQVQDQLACYDWSTQQTGFDPDVAAQQTAAGMQQAQQSAQATQGAAIRGGGAGALTGLAIGAIAGNAGKGAAIGAVSGGVAGGLRRRRHVQGAQASAQGQQQQFQQSLQTWSRSYAACMGGRGYSVN
jgi:hypothetical protein